VNVWQTTSPNGDKITVTQLEVDAVKAWAEAMLTIGGRVHGRKDPRLAFLSGFLGGAMTADDADLAGIIAMGRKIQLEHGERPLMAEPMTESDRGDG
jgi:hypothetical protein